MPLEDHDNDIPRDTRDIMIEVRIEVRGLIRRVDDNYLAMTKLISDLQQRVAILENWKATLIGKLSVITAAVAFAATLFAPAIRDFLVNSK